jgi:hypothetical protein
MTDLNQSDELRSSFLDPYKAYEKRLDQRTECRAKCESQHHGIGNARLAVFISAAVLAWVAFKSHAISPWWLLLPLSAFILLMAWHSRVLQKLKYAQNAVEFYQRGIARLEERWMESGELGTRFIDPSHPYAQDLDLFGKGSLFQLLCSARTLGGEQKLASWLKNPASIEEIRSRQRAVDELRNGLDLREDLAMLGSEVRTGVDPDLLNRWSNSPSGNGSMFLRIFAAVLALLAVASIGIWAFTGNHVWFLLIILFELIFIYSQRRMVRPIISGVEQACRDLQLLSLLLSRLEKEQFSTSLLVKLRASLDREGLPPSKLIARLNYLMVLLDSRRNQFFAPIAFVLLWEMHLAFFIEGWRRRYGHAIPGWLEALSEMEALSSLAGYAFEHPQDPFAELLESSPLFEGRELGHPLLPEKQCVRNDISLSGSMRVLVLSGSNMSGKSTFLRTIGINAVLALAGAPVRARSLRISPLQIGASIRILDSLQEGTSRFYAEITRLQQIVTLAGGPLPLMFLLDELLAGTNSHDRRIGAEAVIKGLVDRNAVGLLTTHDLALAHIAEALAPYASNVHFEDFIENGRIRFDYQLKPGIVQKSNALELMRSIGLEV